MPRVEGYGHLYTSNGTSDILPRRPVVHRGREPQDLSRHPFPEVTQRRDDQATS